MKTILLYIIILNTCFYDIKSQSDNLTIIGNVKDKMVHHNLADIWVELKVIDSSALKTKTDSLGNFKITTFKKNINSSSYIILYQDIAAYKKKYIVDSFCVNLKYYDRQYTGLKYELSNHLNKERDTINVNILMFKQTWCFNYPGFRFKKNSTQLTYNDYYENSDSSWANPEIALRYMNCFLNVNEIHKIVLRGKAGIDEFHSDSLAYQRAVFIKEKLISMGSDSSQIIILQDSNRLSTREKIPTKISKSEKEKLLAKYYYCGLSIIEPETVDNNGTSRDGAVED